MAHEDALNHCRRALAHLDDYMARIGGRSWSEDQQTSTDPMLLLNKASHLLTEYIAKIARVRRDADVIVDFDGADLPVKVEWDGDDWLPLDVHINGKWISVDETWLGFGPVNTRFTAAVRHAMRKQAAIDATP